MSTHWMRLWAIPQKMCDVPTLRCACRILETVAMEIFGKEWMVIF
jgi:hypothetical protein